MTLSIFDLVLLAILLLLGLLAYSSKGKLVNK